MQKIGVFVCHCGTNIAATVDVARVAEMLGREPGVVFATDYPYMCSQTGQQMIQDKIRELGLTGVEFAKERAEEAARKIWREQFDVASARAVAALPVLSEYCLPLVKVGGSFIAMKGPEADAEAKAAANALKKLGGQYEETRQFTLPDGSARGLVFCKKISQTPTVYPRNGGKIAKKPL